MKRSDDNFRKPVSREPAAEQAARTQPLRPSEREPWHEPVDGANLLKELFTGFRQHLVIRQEEALAAALWTLHTYALDAADATPRLAVISPTKRCGKTTLFKILSYVVRHPEPVSNISPASIFRSVEAESPTLLIDEGDSFLRDNRELKNVLNSGHTRETAYVKRCVGKEYEPRKFPTWTPAAIALIGRLPDTLEDRSIEIRMRRKMHTEHVEKLSREDRSRLKTLARKCARWVADNMAALMAANPEIPDSLDDRAADNWRPLLAIADRIGGAWPKRARQSAVVLSRQRDEAAGGEGVELLHDIKGLFEEHNADFLNSEEIVERLTANPLLRWANYKDGHPFTQRRLADLLKAFEIFPSSNGKKRGYKQSDFEDAFNRYLPSRSSVATAA